MHSTTGFQPETIDRHIRRGRQLRSAAAMAIFAAVGRALLRTVERAFVRPYRMTGTPGCGCEA